MGILAKYKQTSRTGQISNPRDAVHDMVWELAINNSYLTDQSIINKFNTRYQYDENKSILGIFDRADLIIIANAVEAQGGSINTNQGITKILLDLVFEIERLGL